MRHWSKSFVYLEFNFKSHSFAALALYVLDDHNRACCASSSLLQLQHHYWKYLNHFIRSRDYFAITGAVGGEAGTIVGSITDKD